MTRVVLAFLVAGIVAMSATFAQTRPSTTQADIEFAVFGVQFRADPAWTRVMEQMPFSIARWRTLEGENSPRWELVYEKKGRRTLDDYADELKLRVHAKRSPETISIGGEPAIRMEHGREVGGDWRVAYLLVEHGDYFYALTAAALTEEKLPLAQVKQLASTLKFVDMASPADAMTLARPGPLKFADATLVLEVPSMYRRCPDRRVLGTTMMEFMAVNLREEARADATMYISVLPRNGGETFQELADNLGKKIGAVWHPVGDEAQRLMSNASRLPEDEKFSPNRYRRMALIGLPNDTFVNMVFLFDTPHPEDLVKYEKLAEVTVRSVKSAGK